MMRVSKHFGLLTFQRLTSIAAWLSISRPDILDYKTELRDFLLGHRSFRFAGRGRLVSSAAKQKAAYQNYLILINSSLFVYRMKSKDSFSNYFGRHPNEAFKSGAEG